MNAGGRKTVCEIGTKAGTTYCYLDACLINDRGQGQDYYCPNTRQINKGGQGSNYCYPDARLINKGGQGRDYY